MKFLRLLTIALILLSINIAESGSVYTDRLSGVNASQAIKVPVKVVAMTALTLSGEQTIDDVACVDGDRVLVTANGVDSGIYVVHTGSWTRAPDWDGYGDVVSGTRVSISQGTVYANTTAYVATNNPIIVGETDLTFGMSLNIGDQISINDLPDAATNKGIWPVVDSNNDVSLWVSNGIEWKKTSTSTANTPTATTIDSVFPTSGDKAGGYTAVIYGTNFVAGSIVRFGGTTATVLSNNGSSISVTVPAHSIGINSITVTDTNGITKTLTNVFTYTEAVLPLPVISSISSGTPGTVSSTITFDTDVNCSAFVSWGTTTTYSNSDYVAGAAADTTSHSHNITGLLPDTTYHFKITVKDINNNIVSSSDDTFSTAAETTFAVISAIDAGTPTETGATITFITDIAADHYIEYGETTGYGFQTTLDQTLATDHSVTLSGLTAGTTYHYAIHVRTAAAAETVSIDQTFDTAAASGEIVTNTLWDNTVVPAAAYDSLITVGVKFKATVAGSITGVKWYNYGLNSGKHVMINLWDSAGTLLASKVSSGETYSGWDTQLFDSPVAIDAETEYTVGYYPYPFVAGYWWNVTASVMTGGVTSDKLYGYDSSEVTPGNSVYSTAAEYPNTLGTANESLFANPIFEYTVSGSPVDALAISNINANNITQTSATISWSLSDFGTGAVELGTVSGIYTIFPIAETSLNYSSHSQSITGLTADTTYYYRVRSTNSSSVETISPVNSFKTLAVISGGGGDYHAPPPTNSLVVSVDNTGATGNGVTDDTAAIQAAINTVGGTGGTVLLPPGTYLVSANPATWPYSALNLKSNMTFKMEAGAVIKLKPNNLGTYTVLNIADLTNVNVVGGKLQGERHQHLTPGDDAFATTPDSSCLYGGYGNCYGQWGMGILIGGSSNVYIDGVESREMWGDGFYQSGSHSQSSNINIYNVVADDNRRQGLSIEHVNGMTVRDSIFKNTGGHLPQDGIDIEPFSASHRIANLQILNNQMFGNRGSGVHMVIVPVIWGTGVALNNDLIDGNNIHNNGWTGGDGWYAGVHVESVYSPSSGVSITGNTVASNIGRGSIVLSNSGSITVTGNSVDTAVYDSSPHGANLISNNN